MSRIHFEVTHPAHVHLFRHAIRELAADHSVVVTSREKDLTTDLLDAYDIEHTVLSSKGMRKIDLITEWIARDLRTLRYDYRYDPDVIVSRLNPTAVHAAVMTGAKSVVFHDHEGSNGLAELLAPFTDRFCTPATFEGDFGDSHRRYDGFQELAYLHPDRFTPDRSTLREHGVDPDEPYFVLRFVSMGAHHDVGLEGLSAATKRRLVEELSEHGEVYVSSEGPIPDELSAQELPVPPEAMLDLLYDASLMVTDSNTMATEAGLLGTPVVRSGAYASDEFSNFSTLAEAGLVDSVPEATETVDRALELAADPDANARWEQRRDAFLEDKIDVTEYIIETVLEVADE